jgi:hypothetical protein
MNRSTPAMFLVACLASALALDAQAQCTPSPTNFCVTVGTKTAAHPNPGGFAAAFYINGTEAPVLTLVRGTTYTFKMNAVPSLHPFFVTTSSIGGFGAPAYTDGTTPSGGVSGNTTMTFAVSAAAPDLLYYNCHNHERMGWKLVIVDPPCPADYNGDTEPDILDFLDFFDDFGSCENLPAPCGSFGEADVNGDTFVDILDFLDFLDAFGSGC